MKQPSTKLLGWLLFILVTFGLIAVASASSVAASVNYGDPFFFFKKQLVFGLGVGLIGFTLARLAPLELIRRYAFLIYAVGAIALLALVFIPEISQYHGGSRRWLDLGLISFQPSEVAKLALIIFLACWLEKQGALIKNLKDGLLPFLVIVGVPALLILLEPDVGTMLILVGAGAAMFFVAGAKISHLILVALIGFMALAGVISLSQHRTERIETFLNQNTEDKLGFGYQINQSLVAIGSGGLFGRGLGHSRQKYSYLPEPAGDSIFAIISEEMGFIISTAVVLMYLLIGHQGIKLAQRAGTDFGRFVIIGIIALILLQAFVNIGAATGLLPLTGVPLPFISYGGTSLAVLLTACGLLFTAAKTKR